MKKLFKDYYNEEFAADLGELAGGGGIGGGDTYAPGDNRMPTALGSTQTRPGLKKKKKKKDECDEEDVDIEEEDVK